MQLGTLEKLSKGRSIAEWRGLQSRGDVEGANALAQQYGQLGTAPRYLKDVSIGGAEAGVDLMMGRAGPRAAPDPDFQQRLQQYKANKAALGVPGRTPDASVLQNPEGRRILTRGTTPTVAPPPNESGYMARKLYKSDSPVSRGEATTQLLDQKERATNISRQISPEAHSMVPAMYGYEAHQTPGGLRHTSQHEYVPGVGSADLTQPDRQVVHQKLLAPAAKRGVRLTDTVRPSTEKPDVLKANVGNVVRTPKGIKVLDFIPVMKGEPKAAWREDLPTSHYQRKGQLGSLRKDVFTGNPVMDPRVVDLPSSELRALPPPPPKLPPKLPVSDVVTKPIGRPIGRAVAKPAALAGKLLKAV